MTAIEYADTIMVRRTVEKGTKVIAEPLKKQNWVGQEFKKFEEERLKRAGDLSLSSSKGTRTFHLSEMDATKIPSTKGCYISTGKGTGLRKL